MRNEVKVAITIFVAIIVAVTGYRFMSDTPLFGQSYQVYAEFDRVDGLLTGTPVYMQGIKVGTISRMGFAENDSIRVWVNLDLPNGLPADSRAVIKSVQILETAIVIERGTSSERLPSGSRIPGLFDEGILGAITSLGEEISGNVNESLVNLNSVFEQVDDILKEGGKDDIEQTLSSLNATISMIERTLNARSTEIEDAILHLKNTLENVENLTADEDESIQNMIKNLESASERIDTLVEGMDEITTDLSDVVRKINEGEGSLGQMINNPSLYNNLDSLSYNLNKLIKDVNDNPRDFLKHLRLFSVF